MSMISLWKTSVLTAWPVVHTVVCTVHVLCAGLQHWVQVQGPALAPSTFWAAAAQNSGAPDSGGESRDGAVSTGEASKECREEEEEAAAAG